MNDIDSKIIIVETPLKRICEISENMPIIAL